MVTMVLRQDKAGAKVATSLLAAGPRQSSRHSVKRHRPKPQPYHLFQKEWRVSTDPHLFQKSRTRWSLSHVEGLISPKGLLVFTRALPAAHLA